MKCPPPARTRPGNVDRALSFHGPVATASHTCGGIEITLCKRSIIRGPSSILHPVRAANSQDTSPNSRRNRPYKNFTSQFRLSPQAVRELKPSRTPGTVILRAPPQLNQGGYLPVTKVGMLQL